MIISMQFGPNRGNQIFWFIQIVWFEFFFFASSWLIGVTEFVVLDHSYTSILRSLLLKFTSFESISNLSMFLDFSL